MRKPTFTYGRTLTQPTSHAAAYDAITRAIAAGKVSGHVNIAVLRTETPLRFDVEATFAHLSPDQALDALAIAAARIGVMHTVPASTAVAIAGEDLERLRQRAEQLVDAIRALGWWEKVAGALQWFGSDAEFRHSREYAIRQVVEALAAEHARPAPARQLAEAAE